MLEVLVIIIILKTIADITQGTRRIRDSLHSIRQHLIRNFVYIKNCLTDSKLRALYSHPINYKIRNLLHPDNWNKPCRVTAQQQQGVLYAQIGSSF